MKKDFANAEKGLMSPPVTNDEYMVYSYNPDTPSDNYQYNFIGAYSKVFTGKQAAEGVHLNPAPIPQNPESQSPWMIHPESAVMMNSYPIYSEDPHTFIPEQFALNCTSQFFYELQQGYGPFSYTVFESYSLQMDHAADSIDKQIDELKPHWQVIRDFIQRIARETFQNEELSTFVYGSLEQGIGLPTSDSDIAVTGLSLGMNRNSLIQAQEKLIQALKADFGEALTECQHISTATVPLIKLKIDIAKLETGLAGNIEVDLIIADKDDSLKF